MVGGYEEDQEKDGWTDWHDDMSKKVVNEVMMAKRELKELDITNPLQVIGIRAERLWFMTLDNFRRHIGNISSFTTINI